MSLPFQPMPLQSRPLPFDDPDWAFELKYDGFRSLAVIEHGRFQLISRNGNLFASFSDLTRMAERPRDASGQDDPRRDIVLCRWLIAFRRKQAQSTLM